MLRKFLAGLLILLSAIFLVLSIVGIGAIWYYNEPATREVTRQLKQIDAELAQAETTLATSEKELERALRIVDSAQVALEKLAEQSEGAENILDHIQSTLDDRLLPELKTARTRLQNARATLERLQSVLTGVTSFVPGIEAIVPTNTVTDLITSTQSLDKEIDNVELLAMQASLFVSDTSFLLGGDLTETRASLQDFLTAIQEYEKKIAGWREQEKMLLAGAPAWIDQASITLTVFLIWFGFSQFILLLYALSLQRGGDPLLGLRRERRYNPLIKNAKDLELED
jgi:F0F1-type ATP synthase membrane subunit b/b'